MPSRYYRRNFINGYFYHIYNRGANKEKVFWDTQDYETFTAILAYYLNNPLGKPLSILKRIENKINPNKVPNLAEIANSTPTIKLCAYCLMPNHFHLLIKQSADINKVNGITNLMRRTTITYAMYVKKKYDHSGTLFQGKFKNVLIQTDSQLQHLSKYIHLNPVELQGSEPVESYEYSSYRCYKGLDIQPEWLFPNEILSFFPKKNTYLAYKAFVNEKSLSTESLQGITID